MEWMEGTLSPEQMAAQQQQQQMLVDALRQTPMFDPNNAEGQQVVQAGGAGGDSTGGMAGGLGDLLGNGLTSMAGNVGTANRYGTNIGSQQTGMLQAQDAGMF